MPCYHPLAAWQSKNCKSNGKRAIVFSMPRNVANWEQINLPCGQCIGCRLSRSRDWAMRCVHEASLHERNCFITLTYNDDNIVWSPVTGEQTLFKKHLQDFLKRLRRRIEPCKVRFFACGEYGDTTHRPHYHAILFGYDFPDKVLYKQSLDGFNYWTSEFLNEVWGHGYCTVCNVSFETCAYVARYVMKKANGELAKDKYEGIQPEFVNMSRRPGISREWFEKYTSDVYPYDEVIIHSNGKTRKLKPCRYYDKLFDEINPEEMQAIKEKRIIKAKAHEEDIYNGRLEAKEKVQLAKISNLKRIKI